MSSGQVAASADHDRFAQVELERPALLCAMHDFHSEQLCELSAGRDPLSRLNRARR
jgi:hypothetical protein